MFGRHSSFGLRESHRVWGLQSSPRAESFVYVGIWEFPIIRGTLLGVPIIMIVVYRRLYWGPLILGKYHLSPLYGDYLGFSSVRLHTHYTGGRDT